MWKDSPDLLARASSLYAERIRSGAITCTCNALADRTLRHAGHAPDCAIELGWPDTLEALRDSDFSAELEAAADQLGATDAAGAEAMIEAAIIEAEAGIPALERAELEARNAAELEALAADGRHRRLILEDI